MKSIKDLDIKGKRTFIRVDFNVPLDEKRNITDDTRLKGALPTIEYALAQGARLILSSHLGRPKGKVMSEFSLAPVAVRLGELLGKEVKMAGDCVGREVRELVYEMKDKDVVLLENLRFYAQEQENDDAFAKELGSLCEVYINDAFAVSHRVNASVAAINRHVTQKGAGLLLEKELAFFNQAMENPRRPLVAIVGGAKISSKLKALENMLQRVDKLIIGGAMANTFLKSMGHFMGASRVEEDLIETAGSVMKRALENGIKTYLPVDLVVADRFASDASNKITPVQKIPEGWMALDIGPATSTLFAEVLADAQTIVWNGPMGVFEMEAFSRGTINLVNSVADSPALSIIGGGDTDAAVHQAGKYEDISFISTGGGAFLTLLEGKRLPAVACLVDPES